jgi:hypothetical protein
MMKRHSSNAITRRFARAAALLLLTAAPVLRAQEYRTIDPSGVWTNETGSLSLMLTGDALSFSYQSVFGETAHICDGAGVAGLESQGVYHHVDEQGTISFTISEREVRMSVVAGVPAFCGANWNGELFTRKGFKAATRCTVSAAKARLFQVMPSPPRERKGYLVAGNAVEVLPTQHGDAGAFVLVRYKGEKATTVGLLKRAMLKCPR